jgi:hypothetical protein
MLTSVLPRSGPIGAARTGDLGFPFDATDAKDALVAAKEGHHARFQDIARFLPNYFTKTCLKYSKDLVALSRSKSFLMIGAAKASLRSSRCDPLNYGCHQGSSTGTG